MARRRRLEPPSDDALADIRRAAASQREARGPFEGLARPPIADVAADSMGAQASEIARLRAEAEDGRAARERLADAEADGSLVVEIGLDEIDVDYLARDRLPRIDEDDDWRALKASIGAHGQRHPVDLARLGPEASKRYGLVAGYRRYGVLAQLRDETGDPRWSRIRAIVRSPATLGQAFLGMVEENEIRAALSHFERARVCVRAVEQGAFPDIDAALTTLFASGSKARRSKIRSFVAIVEELGDLLRHPQAIGERLGLRLAAALRRGEGGALRRYLGEEVAARDAAEELRALERFRAPRAAPSPQAAPVRRELAGGATLLARRTGRGATIELAGRPIDDARLSALADAVARVIEGGD